MMKNKKPFRGRIWSGMAVGLLLSALPFYDSFAQVTIKMPNTTLGTAIKKIQAQKKYQFFYDDNLSRLPVNALNVKDASIETVLHQLLNGKNVAYTIEDNVVYLKKQSPQQPKKSSNKEKTKYLVGFWMKTTNH